MKRVFVIAVLVAVCATCQAVNAFSAVDAARDWKWYFTEVRDKDGNILAQNTGPLSNPLTVNVDPSVPLLKIYATLFNNQTLNFGNIDFVDIHTSADKVGGTSGDFFSSYGLSVLDASLLHSVLPLSAGQNYGPFWIMDINLKDVNKPAAEGTYELVCPVIDIYDLDEPLNVFGNHTLHSIQSSNQFLLQVMTAASPFLVCNLDGNADKDLVVDFGPAYGIWVYYNNSTWVQLHNVSPKSMASGDLDGNGIDDVIVDFGPAYGIWIYYNNSTWVQLHTLSCDFMITGDLNGNGLDDIVIDFGPAYGVWVHYDNGTWQQLSGVSP